MKRLLALLVALLSFGTPGLATAQQPASDSAPLRIFLRAGPKTHGPAGNGLHDHVVWLDEWTDLLTSRGAKVTGALRFPTADELRDTDVLVMFAEDAGTILGEDRANLIDFLKRGGGVVCFHDAVVTGTGPEWFKTVVGGSWENGVARFYEGENTYYYVNPAHPITRGAVNFTIEDEVYWNLHMMPGAQVLAVSMQPERRRGSAGDSAGSTIRKLIPQVWVYENQLDGGESYRAFVSLLGHHFSTFSSPHVRGILLRGIAWAGKRDPDSLATPEELDALGR